MRSSRHHGTKPSVASSLHQHPHAFEASSALATLHAETSASFASTTSHFGLPSPPASAQSSDDQNEANNSQSDDRVPSSMAFLAHRHRRRKRTTIELPSDQTGQLDKTELKRLKNRIAAARARERTQKQIEELKATVEQLRRENQQQQAVIDQLQGVLQTHTTFVSVQDVPTTDPAVGMPRMDEPYSVQERDSGDFHVRLLDEISEMFSPHGSSPHSSYQQHNAC